MLLLWIYLCKLYKATDRILLDKQFVPLAMFLPNVSWSFLIQKNFVLNEKVNMHCRQRSLRYSVLIGSIFLNLHFFFMWCIHILRTSFSLSFCTHARKGKRQLNSISSFYVDKKELLRYLVWHCYWMIFSFEHLRTHDDESYMWGHFYGFEKKNPKQFSIVLSASSTLLCQGRRKYFFLDFGTGSLLDCYYFMAGMWEEQSRLPFLPVIPSLRITWYSVLWIFY